MLPHLGPAPDSEKETQGIRNAINAKLGIKLFNGRISF